MRDWTVVFCAPTSEWSNGFRAQHRQQGTPKPSARSIAQRRLHPGINTGVPFSEGDVGGRGTEKACSPEASGTLRKRWLGGHPELKALRVSVSERRRPRKIGRMRCVSSTRHEHEHGLLGQCTILYDIICMRYTVYYCIIYYLQMCKRHNTHTDRCTPNCAVCMTIFVWVIAFLDETFNHPQHLPS